MVLVVQSYVFVVRNFDLFALHDSVVVVRNSVVGRNFAIAESFVADIRYYVVALHPCPLVVVVQNFAAAFVVQYFAVEVQNFLVVVVDVVVQSCVVFEKNCHVGAALVLSLILSGFFAAGTAA